MTQWTILSLLNWTTEYFQKNSIPSARLDAEVLLAHTLKLDRVQLYVQFERPVQEWELAEYKSNIKRRIAGEPVSYIRGIKEFWSMPFKVGPGVLIPRPDTEVLVECAVRSARCVVRDDEIHILDIGTGSGNIAITLAKEFPQSKITAIDVSLHALKYACENAKNNGVEHQIEFLEQNFLTTYDLRPTTYEIIVSNPPYISDQEVQTLAPGIKDYEPLQALHGGEDGLDFYKKMKEVVPDLLKEGGIFAVEIGERQGEAVKKIFEDAGLSDIEVIKDYAKLDRVVVGYNRS